MQVSKSSLRNYWTHNWDSSTNYKEESDGIGIYRLATCKTQEKLHHRLREVGNKTE